MVKNYASRMHLDDLILGESSKRNDPTVAGTNYKAALKLLCSAKIFKIYPV